MTITKTSVKRTSGVIAAISVIFLIGVSIITIVSLADLSDEPKKFIKEIIFGEPKTLDVNYEVDFSTFVLNDTTEFVLIRDKNGTLKAFTVGLNPHFPPHDKYAYKSMEMLLQTASFSKNAYAKGCAPNYKQKCGTPKFDGDVYRQSCYCIPKP